MCIDKSGKPGSKILQLTIDAHGNLSYDAIVKQNENSKKIMYSHHKDLIPKVLNGVEDDMEREIEQTTQETKAALEKIVNDRLSVAQVTSSSQFIKYKPSQQSSTAFNSGAKQRIIKIVELPVDSLMPSKLQHKRFPNPSRSPPVPVMHSPPRPVTVKDQQDWKIPPCISNWKNPKGYTIPLSNRLQRGLQEVQVNDNFPKFSESLYVAEQKARKEVFMRSKVQKEMLMKENQRKEDELRALAQKARSERCAGSGLVQKSQEETKNRREREKIRRERRLEAKDASFSKKRKMIRDEDREITEKVALMASTGAEVMYDQRMFNQDKGMDSGFGTDDGYNVYDKRLFIAQPKLSTIYRHKNDNADGEMYGCDEDEKIVKTDRFKPDKGFSGASDKAGGPRKGLVQFDMESDLFGLDKFLIEVNKGVEKSYNC